MSIETNQGISHLLDGKVIGLTPTGLPMYEPDPTDEYYQRSIEPRENNLLFLRQEQDVDRMALDSIFNRLNREISKMAENNDEREIYYFPKGSQLSTQSSNVKDNGNHVVYYAVTNERLFARKAKESKSGYEFLPGLDSDVSFYKKQNIGAPNKISTKMIPGLKFYIIFFTQQDFYQISCFEFIINFTHFSIYFYTSTSITNTSMNSVSKI